MSRLAGAVVMVWAARAGAITRGCIRKEEARPGRGTRNNQERKSAAHWGYRNPAPGRRVCFWAGLVQLNVAPEVPGKAGSWKSCLFAGGLRTGSMLGGGSRCP